MSDKGSGFRNWFITTVEAMRPPGEEKKRRREIVAVFFLSLLFVFLTWFEIRLFSSSQSLPFTHSIFFFGLVNINIIILLLLLFLIFRNVVKVSIERREGLFGAGLKSRLTVAFVAFSVVPTFLMFMISVFYIHTSFDKWFSVKTMGILKSSLEVQNAYYFNAKRKNFHYAHQIADSLAKVRSPERILRVLESKRQELALDVVEYYPSLFGRRLTAYSRETRMGSVPVAPTEFLQKGLRARVETSTIQQFGDGNLVRVIVPLQSGPGAVVVSSFIPMSLISRMNDVTNAYEEFRNINPLQYPLKSIHLTMLFLMTMVILFAAIWYGFHLARQLSVPLVQLGRATRKVAEGEYATVEVQSGSQEIQLLIDSFNQMTKDLSSSRSKVQETLSYLEVVLKNISAGVISVDSAGRLTTINRRAADLLKIEPDRYIGRPVRELLTIEYFRTFAEMLKTMEENHVDSIQREQQFNINGEVVPLSMSLTILKDEKGDVIGRVLVFDDLTPIVAAQRSAAWSEVARRIAHEIKNPLTPIKMAAERLRRKFGSQIQDPVFDECTTMIVRQTDDLKNLVNEFSNFARLPETRPVTASLNKVIEEAVSVFRASHPEVPIELSLDPALPEFKLDPDQIKRVLMNLLDNGIAAMQGFIGQIKVQTHYDNELKLVRLTVDDEGPGIPGPDRHRIFEPYYSTKKGGTGLGLAIVKRIVEDHNGFIRALSNQPRGTRMLIELPVPVGGGRKPAEGARA